MEKTWRSRSEEEVDAERPARSGEDEEKPLLGRVAAGDFLSHTHTGWCVETKLGVCAPVTA